MDGCGKNQLHELFEIVWQSGDPDFGQLFNRVEKVRK